MKRVLICFTFLVSINSLANELGESGTAQKTTDIIAENFTSLLNKRLDREFIERKKKYSKHFRNPDLFIKEFKEKADSVYFEQLRAQMSQSSISVKRRFSLNEYKVKVGNVTMSMSSRSAYNGIILFNNKAFEYDDKLNLKVNADRLSAFLDEHNIIKKKISLNFLDLIISKAYSQESKYGDMLKIHLTGEMVPALSLYAGYSRFEDTGYDLFAELIRKFKNDIDKFYLGTCAIGRKGVGKVRNQDGGSSYRVLEDSAMKIMEKLTVKGKLSKQKVLADLFGSSARVTNEKVTQHASCSKSDPCKCLFLPYRKSTIVKMFLIEEFGGMGSKTLDNICNKFDRAHACLEKNYSVSKRVYDQKGQKDFKKVKFEGPSDLGQSALTK